MPDDVILTSVAGRVATLTLNRPDRLNALSPELLTQSIDALTRWEVARSVPAVISAS